MGGNPVTPISPTPQQVSAAPALFPTSLVNIVNPSPAPDPSGLGAARGAGSAWPSRNTQRKKVSRSTLGHCRSPRIPLESRAGAPALLVTMKLGSLARLSMAAALPAIVAAGCAAPGNFFSGMSAVPRTTVSYTGRERPGTVIINTNERRLYLVLGNEQALRYGIGVGRVGFTWAGVTRVSAKKEWPDWTPPPQMLRREPDLPRFMKGGPENPLGARALYLGSTLFRIHGSNEPHTIGQAVSSGCFRLTNDDVIDLYSRVPIGAKVIVMR
jgi:lipoprotein-anchoring transpeptidase ErfK/SrfK